MIPKDHEEDLLGALAPSADARTSREGPERSDDFWSRLHSSFEVTLAVSGHTPDKALGVRDGCLRFVRERMRSQLPVNVRSIKAGEPELPITGDETLELARQRAFQAEQFSGPQTLSLGSESGLALRVCGDQERHFVHCWTVVRGLGEEAWGSSGCLQLPPRLIEGADAASMPLSIPGTRRGGGMVASLTGGLETRRTATALATFHALASLLYGRL